MKEETLVSRKKVLLILGITAGVYFSLKYLLPLVIPFLFALILSRMMAPAVRWLRKKYNMKPGVSASLLLLLGGVILFFLMKYFGSMLVQQIQKLSLYLPFYTKKITIFIKESCSHLEEGMNMEQGRIYPALAKQGENIVGKIVAYFGEYSLLTFRMLLDAFIFLTLMIMGTILLSGKLEKEVEREEKTKEQTKEQSEERTKKETKEQSKEKTKKETEEQLEEGTKKETKEGLKIKPEGKNRILNFAKEVYEQVSVACLSYIKAQLVIMVFDAILAAIGLYILGNPYYLVIGILLGVIDALPLLGTGTVLIPWGILSICFGKGATGIGLLILYGILGVMRQIVEPKIMGKQMNLDLLTSLVFMYAGYRLFGIWGFILGPVGFCIGKSIYENFLRSQGE